MKTTPEHTKRIVNNIDDMYKSMASSLGNRVRCDVCGKNQLIDSAKCLRSGWPKCCGYTMKLLSHNDT